MDEQTRRQITWTIVAGAIFALVVMAGGRRGEINRLRTELAYGSPEARVAAAQQLVDSQKLAEAVADQPRWVQDQAVDAVAYLGTEKAIFQLMTIWTVVDAPVQPRITAAVARFGPLAIAPLVEAMVDKDAKIRAGAPGVLTAIGPQTIPYLLPLMGAWDDYIRTGVATVFGGVGKPVCADLVKIVKAPPPGQDQQGEDTAEYLRRKDCAINSLLNMKINALDTIIQDLLPASDPEIRGQAATMLGTIGAGLKPEEMPQVIPPLLDRMAKDEAWAVRRKATAAMGGLGEVAILKGAVGPLTARLGDPRPEVRAAAAEALGKVTAVGLNTKKVEATAALLLVDPAAAVAQCQAVAAQTAKTLAATLIGNTSGASREISAALVRIGTLSIAPLVPGQGSPSGEVRALVTDTIAQIGGPQAVAPLARALGDPLYGEVRRKAAQALRNQPPEALNPAAAVVLPALGKALQDQDWQVYYAARDALARMGAPAVPVLVAALGSGNSRVGYLAEMALARIGAVAVPGLVQALQSGNPVVVNWASIALGDIGDPAVTALGQTVANGSIPAGTRAAAAKALGSTHMPSALQPLVNAGKDPQVLVRTAALEGLATLADPNGTDTLVAGLSDPDRKVRTVATELLKNWRMGEVQDKLKKVSSADVDAQRRAAIVLVFQNASVTNQLLRSVASASGQVQAAQGGDQVAVLTAAALDASATPDVRSDAIISLGYAGDEKTVGELKKLLTPGNKLVLPAAVAVAQISARLALKDEAAASQELGEGAKLLLDLVMNPTSPQLAMAAATGLATMGELPVPALVEQLQKGTDEQRAWAGAILSAIGKPATELLMRERGKTKSTWCAAVLQTIGDAMALQIMKHLAAEEQPQPAQLQAIAAKLAQIREAQSK